MEQNPAYRPTPPQTELAGAASPGLSRRALIGRLALGAGAVVLLPVVDTVIGASRLAADTPSTPAGDVPTLIAQPKSA